MQTAESLPFPEDQKDRNLSPDRSVTDRPLRICLLGYRSHPFCGGQGVYIKYLSKALVEAGHAVDVVSGEPYPHLDPRVRLIKLPGLNLFESPHPFRALRISDLKSYTNLFEWFSMVSGGFPEPYTFGRRIARYLDRNGRNYDLIHDNQSLCFGLLDLQARGFPVVSTIHHPITRDLRIALDSASSWGHRLLIRRWHSFLGMQKKVAQKLRYLVTVSEFSRRDIAEAFQVPEGKISLVYNGIDTREFSPRPDIERNPFRIMTTASADQPLKGLRFLLEAVAALKPDYPEMELLVIGKIKPGGATKKLIDKHGLASSVTFVSDLETLEIINFYAEATMAVVPSLYEGFGLPAGEAMACGVPVISTDGGALPEVVGDAGVHVPAGDARALSRAIDDLLKHPDKRFRLGTEGRARILETFSWDKAAKQMSEFYQRILAHGND